MNLIRLNNEAIKSFVTHENCVEILKKCLIDFSKNNNSIIQPLRSRISIEEQSGLLLTMPAYSKEAKALGIKLLTAFPNNKSIPSHQGIIMLFNSNNGLLEAEMDAEYLTGIRTSVVSALASQCLGVKNAEVLTIIGTGEQAENHISSHLIYKTWKTIYVVNKASTKLEDFVKRMKLKHPDANIVACTDKKICIPQSDVVCTVTSSSTSVLPHELLKPSCHINCVGAPSPDQTELDTDTMQSAKIVVDSKESAYAESGDVIQSKAKILCELGELLGNDRSEIPISRSDLTVFKSLGLAIEDVVVAQFVLDSYRKKYAQTMV